MNRKVVMPTIALLFLAMMIVSSAKAVTKEPYWAHHEMDLIDPGTIWVSEEGIQHVKDSYWKGTSEGSLGIGTLEIWYGHISLDLATGKGTFSGKLLVTIPDKGTIAGSGRGTITGFAYASGTFVSTIGMGDFEDLNAMGSFSAVFTSPTHALIDCVGTSIYP